MTIEQLEARRTDLVNKLQSALLQKKQIKATVAQLQGALLLLDEVVASMKTPADGKGDSNDMETAGNTERQLSS